MSSEKVGLLNKESSVQKGSGVKTQEKKEHWEMPEVGAMRGTKSANALIGTPST